jgi:hypothetical protein
MGRRLDFTGCTFTWNWKGPRPPAVRHMVEDRAFKSFLADEDAMKSVWTEPTVTGKLENDVFPREKGVDICCADTVGWCAYQTRAVDFLVVNGLSVHWVDTYFPFKKSVHGLDFAKLVDVYGPEDQAKGLDDTNFLPGDYFIYCRIFDWINHANHKHPPAQRIADALAGEEGKVETVGDHINMWLGPFSGFDKDGTPLGEHFDQINGSYGTTGSSHYVLPVDRRTYWTGYEWKIGTYIAHCRFKSIERLFRDVLGPPMRAPPLTNVSSSGSSKPKKSAPVVKPGPHDDLDAFWTAIRDAKAPYPVGTHMGWHQGVHVQVPIKTSDDDKVDGVYSMAPGQVVAVRGASPGLKEGDASFVLIKHQLSKKDRQVVDPTAKSGGAGGAGDRPQPFFSLTMHLSPVSTFLGEKKEGDGPPPLRDSAPAWLRALWPRPLPTGVVPNGTVQTLLTPKEGDPKNEWLSLGAPPNLKLGQDVAVDKLTTVTANDGEYYVIPQSGDTAAAAWVGKATPPAAKGELFLFNPRTPNKILRTHTTVDGSAHLYVAPDPADGAKQRLDVQTVDKVEYARIDLYAHPALRRTGRANDYVTTPAPVDGQPDLPEDVLVLPPKASKGDSYDLYLTTTVTDGKPVVKGPTVSLRFADIVDADAEQTRKQDEPDDTTTHTTVGVRDPVVPTGDADAGKKVGWMWLDLVACVKLTKSKADIETALNDDQVRIQRGVAERLAAGTSRLLGVVASAADDAAWSLEADGYTLDGSSSSDPKPALYATVKARGRGFTVDTSAKQKPADGTWMLSPPGAAGASVHAVDVTPGPTKGTTAALVEVVYGVKKSEVDDATKKAVDAVKSDNDKRKAVIDDLTAGKVIDLRDRVLDPVFVGREPIGAFGKLIAPLGTEGTDRGIHVEFFSGKPLALPADASIPDKTLQPLAGSPWLALKDTSTDDLLSAKAARLLVKELSAHGGAGFAGGILPNMPPASDSDPWQPPTRDEWLTFCKLHERPLARIVSVHPTEWALPWNEAAGKDGSTFVFQTDGAADALKNVHTSLAWTKGPGAFQFTSDDGIADDTAIVFHHPARLLELLRTGIEVSVSAQKSSAAKAKVTYTPAGEAPITLPALEGGGRYGSLIETSEALEGAPSITGTLDVAFDGGSPPPLKFTGVRVVRGASTRYSVVAAYVETSTEWPHARKEYAVDYSEGPPHEQNPLVADFLADGGAYLGEDGYGRVHLRVSAHYNVAVPKFEDPKLGDGSKGFTLDKTSIRRFPDPAKPPASAADDPDQPTSVTAAVTYIEFDVVGKPRDVGITETVSVKVSGDELGGDKTATWSLVTRVIEPKPGKTPTGGADVAQLQLYLALILGTDGLPCYRSDPDDKTTAAIDGNYGPKLRAALFRFCYAYVDARGWGATSLQLKKGKDLSGKATLAASDLAKDATKIHAGLADKATVDTYEARVSDKGGDEWIVIDLPLVQSVVGVFGAGHAVPQAEILAVATRQTLPAAAPDGPALTFASVKDDWARGMFWPDFHVFCALVGDTSKGVDASGTIELKLPDGAPYTLSATGATGSQTLTTTAGSIAPPKGFGFELVPVPGMHWTGKEPAQLVATWKGGRNWQISQRHFQEPRDFTQKWDADQAGMDATLVQFCLSQAPHKAPAGGGPPAPRGFVPPPAPLKKGQKAPATPPPRAATIDGVWTTAWVKALKDYATEWGLPFKSDVVTKLLMHVIKSVPPGP